MDKSIFLWDLGSKVYDSVTKFEGVITGRVEYLTGCNQYLVQPEWKLDSRDFIEARWFDETRLIPINEPKISIPGSIENPGADSPAPIK